MGHCAGLNKPLYIEGFDWEDENIAHIVRHGVEPEEAEEVFFDQPLVRRNRDGRYIALGQSWAGRYLAVVFELRPGNVVRIVTARPMTKAERRLYRRGMKR
jgi:hypothetical protein